MTDDDAGGGGCKNGDFWMTLFVNDPILLSGGGVWAIIADDCVEGGGKKLITKYVNDPLLVFV